MMSVKYLILGRKSVRRLFERTLKLEQKIKECPVGQVCTALVEYFESISPFDKTDQKFGKKGRSANNSIQYNYKRSIWLLP